MAVSEKKISLIMVMFFARREIYNKGQTSLLIDRAGE